VKKGKKIKDGTGGGNRFANEMKWNEIIHEVREK